MTEQEKIEEMAFDLCMVDTCKHLPKEECNKTTCAHCEAEALYRAGYRKQVVGVWENFPSIGIQYRCSVCKKKNERKSVFCPYCGAKMKGGE